MTPEDAVRHLKPGVLIQYTPSLPHGDASDQWFDGVIESAPRPLGKEGTWVVGLCCMEPAYGAATGNRWRTRVAAAECLIHVRLRPIRPVETVFREDRDMLKWDDDAIAVLVAIRKKADWTRRLGTRKSEMYGDDFMRGGEKATGEWDDDENLKIARQLAKDILEEINRVLP